MKLSSVCLQKATAGSAGKEHDFEENRKDRDAVAGDEQFEHISFQTIASAVHADWASTAVHMFTTKLRGVAASFTLVDFFGSLK